VQPRRREWALDLWVLALVAVLTWPMLVHSGFGLARDMVFTPVGPVGAAQLGFGAGPPRAVPLDAVLGLLTHVVGGQVVFRAAVWGVLLLIGTGAHRSVRHLPTASRAAVATFAVWNPFVVERLALGQWALLGSLAAAWWLVSVLPRWLSAGERSAAAALVLLVGLASLTPTGGLVALLLVGSYAVTSRGVRRRAAAALVVTGVLQLPWVLPSLWSHGSTVSDPRGVAAFAARAEHAGGVLGTLLGTGGIWDRFVVPASRGSLLGVVAAVVVCAALVVGVRRQPAGLLVAGALGLVLALLPALPGTGHPLGWFVSTVPGGGLLRDSQKWLVPFVVLAGRCLGETVAVGTRAVSRRDAPTGWAVAAFAVLMPVVLMPDAASTSAAALRPVGYPAGLSRSVDVLDGPGAGDVVSLPWQAYRLYRWANPLSAADPLSRWTTRRVVADDRLATDQGLLSGEDERTAAVGALVASGLSPESLRAAGIGWVLVYRDQPGAGRLPTAGLRLVVDSPEVRLYRVPGDPAPSPGATAPGWVVAATATVDVLLLLGLLAAAAVLVGGRRRNVGRPA
jgi:hypothetical protein